MPHSLRWVVAAGVMIGVATGVTSGQQQTSTSETKTFQVIAVEGNDLIVRLPEGTRQITVPEDFRFTVDGKSLSVRDLKPGMSGTATITTRTTVTPVTVTEVKSATVAVVAGSAVYVRTAEGVKLFNQGDLDKRGIKIFIDGKPRTVSQLHQGDKITATFVTSKPPNVVTEKEVQATLAKAAPAAPAAAPAPAPAPAPVAAAPAPAPAQQPVGTVARTLPKTAGTLWTIGLFGLASLAVAAALTRRRRAL
ncbi:MAG TPA: hypothetical protein VFV95_03170 [Vicinamibacterales bacterium]|nr:hypothetical protein [Vicinamibacterales bacterium]